MIVADIGIVDVGRNDLSTVSSVCGVFLGIFYVLEA